MNDRTIERMRSGLPVFIVVVILGFAFPFLIGLLAGLATPGGWPAWQIGAMASSVAGGVILFFSSLGYFFHIIDF